MIYAILGPTCSGKSDLAYKLSKHFNNMPIINFDAFQVYKEIEKGTAKPTQDEMEKYNLFLYDFVSIKDQYDVSRYQADARKILAEHKDAIMVGGTGLYLKAALFDYKFYEESKMGEGFLKDKTNDELYEMLLKIDKDDALKIGPNNRKRLLRALFIFKEHGKSKSDLNENGKDKLLYPNVTFIGLDIDKEYLYERINKRVDIMFENGLPLEAHMLFKEYDNSLRGLQAIGYKEFLKTNNDEEAKEMIKLNTRHYAKRQFTFFKHQFNNVRWFKSIDEAYETIVNEEKYGNK